MPPRYGEHNRWLEWEHRIVRRLALLRITPVRGSRLDVLDDLTSTLWRDRLRWWIEETNPDWVIITDNVMKPKPAWRPAVHVEWPELVVHMSRLGYRVDRRVTVDAFHRRLFLRTPKWSHPVIAMVTLVLDVGAQLSWPWQKARHTAWRFRAE